MPDQTTPSFRTVVDLGAAVKKKYPGSYDDVPDADLGRAMQQRYPAADAQPGPYDDFLDVNETGAPALPTQPAGQQPPLTPKEQPVALTGRHHSAGATGSWADDTPPSGAVRDPMGVIQGPAAKYTQAAGESILSGAANIAGAAGGGFKMFADLQDQYGLGSTDIPIVKDAARSMAEGWRQIGTSLTDANKIAQAFLEGPPELQVNPFENPEVMANPEWWVRMGGQGVGSMIPFAAGGGLTAYALLSRGSPELLKGAVAKWGPTIAGGIAEGYIEGGAAYNEALDAGKSTEEASEIAVRVAGETAALSAVFGKLGIFSETGGGLARAGKAGAAGAVEEAIQETRQGQIQRGAGPLDLTPEDLGAAIQGAVGGLAGGAAASPIGGQYESQRRAPLPQDIKSLPAQSGLRAEPQERAQTEAVRSANGEDVQALAQEEVDAEALARFDPTAVPEEKPAKKPAKKEVQPADAQETQTAEETVTEETESRNVPPVPTESRVEGAAPLEEAEAKPLPKVRVQTAMDGSAVVELGEQRVTIPHDQASGKSRDQLVKLAQEKIQTPKTPPVTPVAEQQQPAKEDAYRIEHTSEEFLGQPRRITRVSKEGTTITFQGSLSRTEAISKFETERTEAKPAKTPPVAPAAKPGTTKTGRMKKSAVKVGETYLKKVSGKMVPVKITGENRRGGWDAVNTKTGRQVWVKSAQALAPVARPAQAAAKPATAPLSPKSGPKTPPVTSVETQPAQEPQKTPPATPDPVLDKGQDVVVQLKEGNYRIPHSKAKGKSKEELLSLAKDMAKKGPPAHFPTLEAWQPADIPKISPVAPSAKVAAAPTPKTPPVSGKLGAPRPPKVTGGTVETVPQPFQPVKGDKTMQAMPYPHAVRTLREKKWKGKIGVRNPEGRFLTGESAIEELKQYKPAYVQLVVAPKKAATQPVVKTRQPVKKTATKTQRVKPTQKTPQESRDAVGSTFQNKETGNRMKVLSIASGVVEFLNEETGDTGKMTLYKFLKETSPTGETQATILEGLGKGRDPRSGAATPDFLTATAIKHVEEVLRDPKIQRILRAGIQWGRDTVTSTGTKLALFWAMPHMLSKLPKYKAFKPQFDLHNANVKSVNRGQNGMSTTLDPLLQLPEEQKEAVFRYWEEARKAKDRNHNIDALNPEQQAAVKAWYSVADEGFTRMGDMLAYRYSLGEIKTREAFEAMSQSDAAMQAMERVIPRTGMTAEEYKSRRAGALKALRKALERLDNSYRAAYVPYSRWGDWAFGIFPTDSHPDAGEAQPLWYSRAESSLQAHARFEEMQEQFAGMLAEDAKRPQDQRHYRTLSPQHMPRTELVGMAEMMGPKEIDDVMDAGNVSVDLRDRIRAELAPYQKQIGFGSHFMPSRDVPGWDRDFERAVAAYSRGVVSFTEKIKTLVDMEKAYQEMPTQTNTDRLIKQYANEYINYFRTGGGPVHWIAGIMHHKWLGFLNPSAAAVNLTQVGLVTAPVLIEAGYNPQHVYAELAKAHQDASAAFVKGNKVQFDLQLLPTDVREDAQTAFDEGELYDQRTREFGSIARGQNELGRKMQDVSMFFFSRAEEHNRITSFVAAHRLARKNGSKNPKEEALRVGDRVVEDSQYIYGQQNVPLFGRLNPRTEVAFINSGLSALSGLMRVFQTHKINTFHTFGRLARKTMFEKDKDAALALLVMGLSHFLVAGISGLPLVTGFMALADWWDKAFGEDVDRELELWERLNRQHGPEWADTIIKGVPATLGVDVSGRINIGDPFGMRFNDVSGSLFTPLGLGEQVVEGVEQLAEGRYRRGAETLAPAGISNISKAIRQRKEGVTTKKGDLITLTQSGETKPTVGETITTAVGLRPSRISRASSLNQLLNLSTYAGRELQSRYTKKFADAVVSGDRSEIQSVLDEIKEVNKTLDDKNKIILNETAVKRAVTRSKTPLIEKLQRVPKDQRKAASEMIKSILPP
jgi:hypothetical protein